MKKRANATSQASTGLMPQLSTATWMLVFLVALCVVGVVIVGSASSVVSMSLYGSPWSIFFKELIWMMLGTIALIIAMKVDYHVWRKFAPILVLVTLGLLLVVLTPGLSVTSGGSSRWIGFGQFRLQPSELMKLALALFAAHIVAKRQADKASTKMVIGPLIAVALIAMALVFAQPDMGTAIVLLVVTLSVLFAAGIDGKLLFKGLVLCGIAAFLLGMAMPYRRERLLSFVNPGAKADGSGYQVVQSLIGFGSGHLLGLGLGNSREKWGLLPNPHTDFIFSIVGEELGLIGALTVIVLMGAFVLKCFRAAEAAPDRFGQLLCVGLASWIGAEAIINIGAVVGVLPVTGIPLPFVSFGGSSLVITMAAAGIMVNIARQGSSAPTTLRRSSAQKGSGRPKSSTARSRRAASVR